MKIKQFNFNLLLNVTLCSTLLLAACNSDVGSSKLAAPVANSYKASISQSTSFIYTKGAENKYQLIFSNQGQHTLRYSGASVIAGSNTNIKIDAITNIYKKCSVIKPNTDCLFEIQVPKISNEQQLYVRYKFIDINTAKEVFIDKYFVFKNVGINDSTLAISPKIEDFATGNLSAKQTITVPFVLWKKFKTLNVTLNSDHVLSNGSINCYSSNNNESYAIGSSCNALVSLDATNKANSIVIKGVTVDNATESSWTVDLTNFNAAHRKLGYPELVYINSPVILDYTQGSAGLHKQVTIMNVGNQAAINLAINYQSISGNSGAVKLDASDCGSELASGANCMIKLDYDSSLTQSIGVGKVGVNYASLNNPVQLVHDFFSVLYKANYIASMFLAGTESGSYSDYTPSLTDYLPPPAIKHDMVANDKQNVGSFVITADNNMIPVEYTNMKRYIAISGKPYFSLGNYNLTSSTPGILDVMDYPSPNLIKELIANEPGDIILKATATIGTFNEDSGTYIANTYTAYAAVHVTPPQDNYLYIAFPGIDENGFSEASLYSSSTDSVLQVFKYNRNSLKLELSYRTVSVDTRVVNGIGGVTGSSISDMVISDSYNGNNSTQQRLLLVDGFHGRIYPYLVESGAGKVVSRYAVPDQGGLPPSASKQPSDGILKPVSVGVYPDHLGGGGGGFFVPHTINPLTGSNPEARYPSQALYYTSNSAASFLEGISLENYGGSWNNDNCLLLGRWGGTLDATLYGCLTAIDHSQTGDMGDSLLAVQSISQYSNHYLISMGYESMIFSTLDNYDAISQNKNIPPKLTINAIASLDQNDPHGHKIKVTGINDSFSNALIVDINVHKHIFFINPNNALLQQYDYDDKAGKLIDQSSKINYCSYKGAAGAHQTKAISTIQLNGDDYLLEAYDDGTNQIYVNDYSVGSDGVLKCNPDPTLSNFSVTANNADDWPRFAIGKNGVVYLLLGNQLNYGVFNPAGFNLTNHLDLIQPDDTGVASSLLTN